MKNVGCFALLRNVPKHLYCLFTITLPLLLYVLSLWATTSVSLMFACNFKAVALAGGVGAQVQIYMQTNETSYCEVTADGAGILLGSFCMLSY